jgi:hypothetical protein
MEEKKNNLLDLSSEINKNRLIGKTINFGYDKTSENEIEWEVIGENKDSLLLITKHIVKAIPFSLDLHKDNYNLYHDSLIREYLANDFTKYFHKYELDMIKSFGKDKFYILSEDDLVRYYNIDYQRENSFLKARPTQLLFSEGFETNESGFGKYWLKNFDSRHDYAKIIDSFGNITRAKIDNPNIGIRVCCWIEKNVDKKMIE